VGCRTGARGRMQDWRKGENAGLEQGGGCRTGDGGEGEGGRRVPSYLVDVEGRGSWNRLPKQKMNECGQ
jgi:hypothetical protein